MFYPEKPYHKQIEYYGSKIKKIYKYPHTMLEEGSLIFKLINVLKVIKYNDKKIIVQECTKKINSILHSNQKKLQKELLDNYKILTNLRFSEQHNFKININNNLKKLQKTLDAIDTLKKKKVPKTSLPKLQNILDKIEYVLNKQKKIYPIYLKIEKKYSKYTNFLHNIITDFYSIISLVNKTTCIVHTILLVKVYLQTCSLLISNKNKDCETLYKQLQKMTPYLPKLSSNNFINEIIDSL